jgi:hypothetical protein
MRKKTETPHPFRTNCGKDAAPNSSEDFFSILRRHAENSPASSEPGTSLA